MEKSFFILLPLFLFFLFSCMNGDQQTTHFKEWLTTHSGIYDLLIINGTIYNGLSSNPKISGPGRLLKNHMNG
jgi:hypothetical protein